MSTVYRTSCWEHLILRKRYQLQRYFFTFCRIYKFFLAWVMELWVGPVKRDGSYHKGSGSCHHPADIAAKPHILPLFGTWVRINWIAKGVVLNTIIMLHYIHNTRVLKDLNITLALGHHTASTDIAETPLRELLSSGVAILILMPPPHIGEHSPRDLQSRCVDSVLALGRRMFGIRAECERRCFWCRFFCSTSKDARVPTHRAPVSHMRVRNPNRSQV
jgi:hypothetical protein